MSEISLSTILSTSVEEQADSIQKSSYDTRPIHLYFDVSEIMPRKFSDFTLLDSKLSKKIIMCSDWNELITSFRLKPSSISISVEHLQRTSLIESIAMIETFLELLNPGKEVNISLIIKSNTPYQFVKEAKRLRIIGIVPCSISFGINEETKGLETQWANIAYWPKHIIKQLPGAPKEKPPKPHSKQIQLTNREQQIFDIVTKKACSNKHIARLLNISESTVKLHLGNIFKKYNVRTRTQLAVFTR